MRTNSKVLHMQKHTYVVSYSTKCSPHVINMRKVVLHAKVADAALELAAVDAALAQHKGECELQSISYMLV